MLNPHCLLCLVSPYFTWGTVWGPSGLQSSDKLRNILTNTRGFLLISNNSEHVMCLQRISKYLDIFHLHICLLQSCHQFTFFCHHFTPEERLSFDNFSRILLSTFRAARQTFSSHQRWPTPIEAEMKNLRPEWIWDFPSHLNFLTFVTLSHGLKFWRILQRVLVSLVNSRTWEKQFF